MKIIKNLDYNPNLVLALGFFDGIHLAHQELLKSAVQISKENSLKSAVITFKNHPLFDLKNIDVKFLFDNHDKYEFIKELGIDYIYELDFKEFMNMTADDYLKNVIYKYFKPKYIVTGFNHTFGKHQGGNSNFLEENQKIYCYIYKKIKPVYLEHRLVSTTKVKELLNNGNIELANKMLGKNFKIKNVVIKGNQIGRTIGFPTINLKWPNEIYKIPFGVYSGSALGHNAIINWGCRPTINGKEEVLEAHIINFNQDLYGQQIEILFNKKIRDEIKFNNIDELKHQIQIDLNSI